METHGVICRSCGRESGLREAFERDGEPIDEFECPACGGGSFGV